MKRNTQPQEETKMEQQPQSQEYTVRDNNDQARTVRVEGDTFLFDNGSYTERHSFIGLVNRARKRETPEWTRQIPGLAERIEAVFRREQREGLDPFTRYSNSDGRLTVTDSRAKTSFSAPIEGLKRQFALTGKLPRAFDTPRAKALLGLTA
jgi:hypothetical protein